MAKLRPQTTPLALVTFHNYVSVAYHSRVKWKARDTGFFCPQTVLLGNVLVVDTACRDSEMFCAVSTDPGLALDIAKLSMSDSSINSSVKKS